MERGEDFRKENGNEKVFGRNCVTERDGEKNVLLNSLFRS